MRGKKLREINREFRKGKCCINCGSWENLSVDHIRPKSLGYTFRENRQVLCEKCNRKKGILSIDYSTRTLILEPFVFSLSREERLEYLRRPQRFGSDFFNPLKRKSGFKLGEVWP